LKDKSFDVEKWLKEAVCKLKKKFSGRLLFVGFQGSYARGEATKESDIDLVVILDNLNFEDLKLYRSIINRLPYSEKACGFISGKNELQKWSKTDLFQFFYDTKPLEGKLDDIIEPPKKEDIEKAIKTGAENLYHSAVHSFIHSNDYIYDLKNLYKNTFFILQAKYFVEKGKYIQTKKELSSAVSKELSSALKTAFSKIDEEILEICINKDKIPISNAEEIEELYEKLIIWSRQHIS